MDEIVIVDMQSDDGTRAILEKLAEINQITQQHKDIEYITPIRILDGLWDCNAGETLRQAHAKYIECDGDVIVHFEADEVYDDSLIRSIVSHAKVGHDNIAVYRLQLELNFQRCRWYPEAVHRVFSRSGNVRKDGHTTDQHSKAFQLMPKSGYLWDITNCFRDNWLARVEAQAELRQAEPQYLITPIHTLHKAELTEHEAQKWIYGGNFWQWTNTPFNIPEILRPLVGATKYEAVLR